MMGWRTPEDAMSITITDPALLAQLRQASGMVDLKDPAGTVIGRVFVERAAAPPGMKSPVSDEEFEEARKQTGGRPLADILHDLRRKYGE